MTLQSVNAGSAVAMEPRHGNLATAYGGPMQREAERALAEGRRRYGPMSELSPRVMLPAMALLQLRALGRE